MEFTAESNLLRAQHLLVQFLCQKSYYNDNNNINSKLYNAQFLLNDYVSNQHKLMLIKLDFPALFSMDISLSIS